MWVYAIVYKTLGAEVMHIRNVTLYLAALMTVIGWPMPGGAGEAEAEALPAMLKAQGEIVVDGQLDEPDWQRAIPIDVQYIYPGTDRIVDGDRMTVRYLWDDAYLYIGYDVFDTNLVVQGTGVWSGPADNQREGCEIAVPPPATPVDVIEFFVLFDDPNMFWEIHHNAANQFNDVLCIVDLPAWRRSRPAYAAHAIYFGKHEYIQDRDAHKLAMAVMLKPRADGSPSTVNHEGDKDTGYVGELRIPWYGLGAPSGRMAGREVSILAVSQDGDAEHRYTTSARELRPTFFHLNTATFPRYRLVDEH